MQQLSVPGVTIASYLGVSVSGEEHAEQVCDVTAQQVLVIVGNGHVGQESQSGQLHGGVQGTRQDILADLMDVRLKAGGEE